MNGQGRTHVHWGRTSPHAPYVLTQHSKTVTSSYYAIHSRFSSDKTCVGNFPFNCFCFEANVANHSSSDRHRKSQKRESWFQSGKLERFLNKLRCNLAVIGGESILSSCILKDQIDFVSTVLSLVCGWGQDSEALEIFNGKLNPRSASSFEEITLFL